MKKKNPKRILSQLSKYNRLRTKTQFKKSWCLKNKTQIKSQYKKTFPKFQKKRKNKLKRVMKLNPLFNSFLALKSRKKKILL